MNAKGQFLSSDKENENYVVPGVVQRGIFVQRNVPKNKNDARAELLFVCCLCRVLVAVAVFQLLKGDKHARRFPTTIFSATQRCNIVETLFRIVTILFQHCLAVLRKKSSLRIVLCNTIVDVSKTRNGEWGMSTWNGKIILKMEIKYRIGNEVTDRARVQLGFVPIFHFFCSPCSFLALRPPFPVPRFSNISLLSVLPRRSFYHRLLFNLLPTRLTCGDHGCDPLQEDKTSECAGNTSD